MSLNAEGMTFIDGRISIGDGEATIREGGELVVGEGAKMNVTEDGVTCNGERWVPQTKLDLLRSKHRAETVVKRVIRFCSPLPSAMTETLLAALDLTRASGILLRWSRHDE